MAAIRVLLLVGLDYTKIDPNYLRVGRVEYSRLRSFPLNKEPH
jgi:hypothetical protein